MFDILLTTYEFISGVGYFVYSVASSFNNFVRFITAALPYSMRFIEIFSNIPILVAIAYLVIGTRLIRFIRGVS